MRRIEGDARLDGPAAALEGLAGAVAGSPAAAGALRGVWLGHALHPLLLPAGAVEDGARILHVGVCQGLLKQAPMGDRYLHDSRGQSAFLRRRDH